MKEIHRMLDNNRDWAGRMRSQHPGLLEKLAQGQSPRCLWIGCSDSRVPAEHIVELPPGELFMHRNIANVVAHADANCLSVLQYAVDVLKVRYVIVCGHDGCGGVRAALGGDDLPDPIGGWLEPVRALATTHARELEALPDEDARVNRLSELNVMAQVRNVCRTDTVQAAWSRGQPLSVLGWIYGLGDGLLRDLDVCVDEPEALRALEAEGITD